MPKQLRREDIKAVRAVAVGEAAFPIEFRVELKETSEVVRESFGRNSKLDDGGKAMLAVVKDVVDDPGEERVDNLSPYAKWLLDSVVDDLTNDRPVSDLRFGLLNIEEAVPDDLLKSVNPADLIQASAGLGVGEDVSGKVKLIETVLGEPEIIPVAPDDLPGEDDFDSLMDVAVDTVEAVEDGLFLHVLFRTALALDGGDGEGRFTKCAVEIADEIAVSRMTPDEAKVLGDLMSGKIQLDEPLKPED